MATMEQNRLASLALISIQNDFVIDPSTIVDAYMSESNHRIWN